MSGTTLLASMKKAQPDGWAFGSARAKALEQGQKSTSMFTGALSSSVRSHLAGQAKAFDGKVVVVGCSGNFTIEATLSAVPRQAQGGVCKPAALHGNDVSLYSCALGGYLSGQPVQYEVVSPEFDWLPPLLTDDESRTAALPVLLDMLEFEPRNNQHRVRMWNLYRENFSDLLAHSVERLGKLDFRLASFYAGDVFDHFRRFESERMAVFCCYAPTPPYSSGGFTRSDRNADPASKYVQTGVEIIRSSFSGDNRDGRSWCYWMALWLSECARIVKPSGYALTFCDWRQLPLASDALQAGGFVWRGVVAWDKGESARAPHTGYFRHQTEFVVWGTLGVSVAADWGGPWPGYISQPIIQADKWHMTGKPTGVMTKLVQCVRPGGVVLDPFMGSGTTGVACVKSGRQFVGIEIERTYFEIAERRIAEARLQPSLLPNPGFHLAAAPVGLWDAEDDSGAAAGEPNRS